MSGSEGTSDVEGTAANDAAPAPVDQKAAFKAALEKKKAVAHARNEHMAGDNHISGDSHAAGAKRVFRRKSG